MEKYETEPISSDAFDHSEAEAERLQERADEMREDISISDIIRQHEEDKAQETDATGYDRLKAECERDAKFAIAQFKMMQPLYDLLTPKIK